MKRKEKKNMHDKTWIKENNNIIDFLHEHIENSFSHRNYEVNGEVYNSCEITECDRRLLFRVNNTETSIKYSRKYNIDQKAIKDKWISILSGINEIHIKEKYYLVADCNYNLSGLVDCIAKVGKKHVVFSIWQIPTEKYNNISASNYKIVRKNIVDILVKMWLSELKHGILILEDSSTNQYKILHITPYEPVIQSVCSKCKKLEEYRLFSKLPDRSYKNSDNVECKLCEYKDICWK